MSLKPVLCAGICLCIALPLGAKTDPVQDAVPLTITADSRQEIPPSLQKFILQVWAENPIIQGAQAALEAARARVDAAGKPLYNPTLELDAEQTDINTSTVGLNQTIDWGDQKGALQAIAGHELRLAEAQLRAKRQNLTAEILEALIRYTTTQEMYALSLRRSHLMKSFVDTVEQRHAAGDVAAADMMLARVAYSEALIAQASSESELAGAEAALQGIAGLTPAQWPSLPGELTKPPARADKKLLETLPQLAIYRARLEVAKARIELAERQRKTAPTLGIRAGREDKDQLLGLTLEVPLFVRNSFKAQVRAAAREAVVEEQAYRNAYRRASARLEGALARFQNTSRAWQVWSGTGEQALHEQMRLLEQMWQAQELSATDFLIQAKQNIDTQATATGLKRELWLSAVAWLSASGQIETWLGMNKNESEAGGVRQ